MIDHVDQFDGQTSNTEPSVSHMWCCDTCRVASRTIVRNLSPRKGFTGAVHSKADAASIQLPSANIHSESSAFCAYPPISTDTLALHGAGVRTGADASTVGAAAAEMLLADMNAGVDHLQRRSIYVEP